MLDIHEMSWQLSVAVSLDLQSSPLTLTANVIDCLSAARQLYSLSDDKQDPSLHAFFDTLNEELSPLDFIRANERLVPEDFQSSSADKQQVAESSSKDVDSDKEFSRSMEFLRSMPSRKYLDESVVQTGLKQNAKEAKSWDHFSELSRELIQTKPKEISAILKDCKENNPGNISIRMHLCIYFVIFSFFSELGSKLEKALAKSEDNSNNDKDSSSTMNDIQKDTDLSKDGIPD